MGHTVRTKLTKNGLLIKLANHETTNGALLEINYRLCEVKCYEEKILS